MDACKARDSVHRNQKRENQRTAKTANKPDNCKLLFDTLTNARIKSFEVVS
jgi:hypothetical protein